MTTWQLPPALQHLHGQFGSLDDIFKLNGPRVSYARDFSEVVRVEIDGQQYYVKRYQAAGKGIRRFFGKPRIQREWENLLHFDEWGIPTAPLVAYGMEYRYGLFRRGAMITAAIPDSIDLLSLATNHDPRLRDRQWVAHISSQIAAITRALHAKKFIHGDLKWRNILVNENGEIFLIDSPCGTTWSGSFLKYRIKKEIFGLDRYARRFGLSRSQRLRFFLQYLDTPRLDNQAKIWLREIMAYRFRRDQQGKNKQ